MRETPAEDKRTWRDGMKPRDSVKSPDRLNWTAMDILTAYADAKGWVTAQAGRPDVHRAGNYSKLGIIELEKTLIRTFS